MSIRQSLISTYLHEEEVYEVVGHDILVFLKIGFSYAVLIAAIRAIGFLLRQSLGEHIILDWTLTALGVVIYCKGTLDLLDSYLDALLITNVGLILFKRDGIFKQKATNIQRVSVETVLYEQNTFRDTLFRKGDIKIHVEDIQYVFKEVPHPSQKVTHIIARKEKILGRYHYTENEDPDDTKDKYELLVEALGEVVTEYVEKKNNKIQF